MAKLAREEVVSEDSNICSFASVVIPGQVVFGWIERFLEMDQPLGVSTDEIEDALLGISQCDQRAALPDLLDCVPLCGTRVLKLVEDDERIHGRYKLADLC